MRALGDLVDALAPDIVRQAAEILAEEGITPVLDGHALALLFELAATLRSEAPPPTVTSVEAAVAMYGSLDVDVDALVRECDVLRTATLDAVEGSGAGPTWREARIFADFFAEATKTAVGVALHAQELVRRLLIDAPVGIAIHEGPQHAYAFANAAYRQLVGGRDVVGKALLDAVPELRGQGYEDLFDAVKLGGNPMVGAAQPATIERDGKARVRWFNYLFAPKRNIVGDVDGLYQCAVEVTEQVEAVQRMELLLSLATALGESLEQDVILRRIVDFVAPKRGRLAGFWLVEPGQPLRRSAHAPYQPEIEQARRASTDAELPIREVLATGRTLLLDDYEAWMTERGSADMGRAVAALGIRPGLFVPVRRGAAIIAVLTIARGEGESFAPEDIAVFESAAALTGLALENARLFAESIRLRESAEDATVAKDRFLAHVSHDLRNPLSTILGWVTVLQKDPQQLARGLEVIERGVQAQVKLTDDLLDIARITAGKLSLELAVEDVAVALDAALDAARLAAEAKEVALELDIEEVIGAIRVDPGRFRQIVWNLASNAVKFTPRGGRVRVEARRDETSFVLTVSDTGRGISPSFLPRVFNTFEQSAEESGQRGGGLGLGLAIVRHLVELHGGTVSVTSAGVGQGATFVVVLPIRPLDRPSVRV